MQKAQRTEVQPFDAHDWRIGVVVAQFNNHITGKLLASALVRTKDYQISNTNVDTFTVAGAIEIPLVLQQLAKSGKYDALLAIGCIIKGDTPHFDYVCKFVTEGILQAQLDNGMPIGFGILTCNDEAQAITRANLGGEHLDAVLQQAKVISGIPARR